MSTGGMPSSHSAVVCSLLTTLILNKADSKLLAACITFSTIVMYDAANIRRSAGDHAILLNKLNKVKKKLLQKKKIFLFENKLYEFSNTK